MKKKSIFGLIGILIAGGLIGFGVLTALNSGTGKVVVPATKIKAGEKFTSENLKTVDMPKKAIIQGVTISSVDEVIGKVSTGAISANEMITANKVAETISEGYLANMNNPEKNYGVQIAVSESNPIQGVQVGDYVSVVANIEAEGGNKVSGKIGNKYKVIGIVEDEQTGRVSNVTIEVEPENLTSVSLAATSNAVTLAFVSKDNNGAVPGITQPKLISDVSK